METKFEIIDHTADVGIRVRGKTLNEIFEQAALGMFSLLSDLDAVEKKEEEEIGVSAIDSGSLLVRWLSELLFRYETHDKIYCWFEVKEISETSLLAKVKGEKIDLSRHTILTEIKSVTYHLAKIEEKDGGFEASVIFDL